MTKTAEIEQIVEKAIGRGDGSLSEYDSKLLLKEFGIEVTREKIVASKEEVVSIASEIGYPLVLKASGPGILHKTERKLVVVDIRSEDELLRACDLISENLKGEKSDGFLVQQMVRGEREFVIGMVRDPQFGPCVMFGLGGIFTEALKDISFRMAPITEADALEMTEEIKAKAILGPVRGLKPVKKDILAKSLVGLGSIGMSIDAVKEIDVNPLKIDPEGTPVAVDALVILTDSK